jgi:hypothetical protein
LLEAWLIYNNKSTVDFFTFVNSQLHSFEGDDTDCGFFDPYSPIDTGSAHWITVLENVSRYHCLFTQKDTALKNLIPYVAPISDYQHSKKIIARLEELTIKKHDLIAQLGTVDIEMSTLDVQYKSLVLKMFKPPVPSVVEDVVDKVNPQESKESIFNSRNFKLRRSSGKCVEFDLSCSSTLKNSSTIKERYDCLNIDRDELKSLCTSLGFSTSDLVKYKTPLKKLTRQNVESNRRANNTKVNPVDLTSSKDDEETVSDDNSGNVKFEFSDEDDDVPITHFKDQNKLHAKKKTKGKKQKLTTVVPSSLPDPPRSITPLPDSIGSKILKDYKNSTSNNSALPLSESIGTSKESSSITKNPIPVVGSKSGVTESTEEHMDLGKSDLGEEILGESDGDNEILGESVGDNEILGESVGDNEILGESVGDNEILGESVGDNEILGESVVDNEILGESEGIEENPEESTSDVKDTVESDGVIKNPGESDVGVKNPVESIGHISNPAESDVGVQNPVESVKNPEVVEKSSNANKVSLPDVKSSSSVKESISVTQESDQIDKNSTGNIDSIQDISLESDGILLSRVDNSSDLQLPKIPDYIDDLVTVIEETPRAMLDCILSLPVNKAHMADRRWAGLLLGAYACRVAKDKRDRSSASLVTYK